MTRSKKPPETLDALLLACGMGRWNAAVAAGISPTTLRSWCEGKGQWRPQNAKLAALAAALGVPVERVAAAVEASAK